MVGVLDNVSVDCVSMQFTPCYMLLFLCVGKIFLNFLCISIVYINNICIFVENIKTKRYEKH